MKNVKLILFRYCGHTDFDGDQSEYVICAPFVLNTVIHTSWKIKTKKKKY